MLFIMLSLFITSWLIGLCFSQSSSMQHYPVISPPFAESLLNDPVWEGISAALKASVSYNAEPWSNSGILPSYCVTPTEPGWGLPVKISDIDVYTVTYDDCPIPILVCYQARNAGVISTLDEFLTLISRVPPDMRAGWHTVWLSTNKDASDPSCNGNSGGDRHGGYTYFRGMCRVDPAQVESSMPLHENCHVQDFYGDGSSSWYGQFPRPWLRYQVSRRHDTVG